MPQGFPDYWVEKAAHTPLVVIGCHDYVPAFGQASYGAWPVANLGLFMPITINEAVTIKRMFVNMTGTSGNADVGIYDEDGKRLVSVGGFGVPTAGQTMSIDIADTLLEAGRYYLAVVCNSTVPQFLRWVPVSLGGNLIFGVREVAAAYPLPATVTYYDHATRSYIAAVAATLQA